MFHKLERSPSKGYQLFNLGSHWELHSSTGVFKGDLKKVCTYAVIQLGFPFRELEVAVEYMEKELHDGAEFGIYKSFMFTFDRREKYDKRSGTLH
jgi:hypothetical protein